MHVACKVLACYYTSLITRLYVTYIIITYAIRAISNCQVTATSKYKSGPHHWRRPAVPATFGGVRVLGTRSPWRRRLTAVRQSCTEPPPLVTSERPPVSAGAWLHRSVRAKSASVSAPALVAALPKVCPIDQSRINITDRLK